MGRCCSETSHIVTVFSLVSALASVWAAVVGGLQGRKASLLLRQDSSLARLTPVVPISIGAAGKD